MKLNLDDYKHIHCLGIGGIGLSAVAKILKSRGFKVSGTDIKPGAVTEQLEAEGIKIYTEHFAENLGDADLVVYSNAVSAENPEIKEAERRGIPVVSRAEALGAIMDGYGVSIAVSGTHGKTTTTSMVSLILENAGLSPTILVGGVLTKFGGNVSIGSGDYFVTEACEYMDSFLCLRPRIEIILNIDSDHLDYFKDIEHITRSFASFASFVPKDGLVVAYDANPFVKSITEKLECRVLSFGFSESSDFYAKNIKFNGHGRPSFDLYKRGELLGNIQLAVPGEHNVSDSLAAAATCMDLGVNFDIIKNTLEAFTGTQRRFDIIGTISAGASIIDDYAHHPTEISATLSAAAKMPHSKIWCLFQPHTYTRTLALFDRFADAFEHADIIVLAEIYAARENNIYKLSSEKLAEEIKKQHPGKEVLFVPDFDDMAELVLSRAEPGDLVITMGAGDIYKVGELILRKDAAK